MRDELEQFFKPANIVHVPEKYQHKKQYGICKYTNFQGPPSFSPHEISVNHE